MKTAKCKVIDFINKQLNDIEYQYQFITDEETVLELHEEYDDYVDMLEEIVTNESFFPKDAHSFEVFAIKDYENSLITKESLAMGITKEAYIGYKLANGNFEYKTIPYTEPKETDTCKTDIEACIFDIEQDIKKVFDDNTLDYFSRRKKIFDLYDELKFFEEIQKDSNK